MVKQNKINFEKKQGSSQTKVRFVWILNNVNSRQNCSFCPLILNYFILLERARQKKKVFGGKTIWNDLKFQIENDWNRSRKWKVLLRCCLPKSMIVNKISISKIERKIKKVVFFFFSIPNKFNHPKIIVNSPLYIFLHYWRMEISIHFKM